MEREITLGLFAIVLGALGAFMVSRIGCCLGLVDQPTTRSSHSRTTPKGGGVGMAAAFLVTSIVLDMPIAFWLPLGVMAGLSLRGDQVEISPKLRLPAQLILMGILVIGTAGGIYQDIPRILIALFWTVFIIGTANFYNFMDGIDGIAGISGVVGFGLLAFATYKDHSEVSLLSACMALACLGFLPFNLPRARVFMGDVGSIVLGGVFAGLVYLASHTLLDFLCMASFLFPFYADELTTMFVRLRDGENLTQPHRRHIYQLLANERQIPHWRISTDYGLFQLLVGVSVLFAKTFGVAVVLAVLASWFFLFVLGGYFVRGMRSCGNGQG
ncbi:MAG: glycosyltransferase family 4 protein [Planctomycetes bacterium]|nr:glycosyltransferase family 4 protein [Planctomycetota bacterium]